MTAEHMRRAIHDAFRAYENSDRGQLEKVIADEGFSFTSPYDDHIDRETYFQRCWPNHETTKAIKVERIFVEGDGAYATYLLTPTRGHTVRNTEYFVFRGGKIASVEVFFGVEYSQGIVIPKQG